jgi:hypothetical protein
LVSPSSSGSCGLKQKNQAPEHRLLGELLLHHFNKLASIRRPLVNISIEILSSTYINSLHQFIKSPQKKKAQSNQDFLKSSFAGSCSNPTSRRGMLELELLYQFVGRKFALMIGFLL